MPHIEKFSEKDNARQGFFEPDELERMLTFLPDYLKDITRLSYQVAQRRDPYLRVAGHPGWRDPLESGDCQKQGRTGD